MKKSPLITRHQDKDVFFCRGIVISVRSDNGMVNAGIPAGPKGGIGLALHEDQVTVRTFSDKGHKTAKIHIERTNGIIAEVFNSLAEIEELTSWRALEGQVALRGWLIDRIIDLREGSDW